MLVSSSHYERVVVVVIVVVVFLQFAEAEQLYRRLVDDTNACQYQVHTAQVSTLTVTFVYICTYIRTCVSTYVHTYLRTCEQSVHLKLGSSASMLVYVYT